MTWADYRELLGIGFEDESKFDALRNKFYNFTKHINTRLFTKSDCCSYFIYVGEVMEDFCTGYILSESFNRCNSVRELVMKASALYNSYRVQNRYDDRNEYKKALLKTIKSFFNDLNISFELKEDQDGIFIFQKGIEEFDEELVSKPLHWLKDYPNAEKSWSSALKAYSERIDDPSNIADLFRKALERFFQDFFSSEKSLENLKSEYGNYMKNHGIPTDISNNFQTILGCYTNFNNNNAKHHDKTGVNVLEYIMYETGNIIRLLITLKNQDNAE